MAVQDGACTPTRCDHRPAMQPRLQLVPGQGMGLSADLSEICWVFTQLVNDNTTVTPRIYCDSVVSSQAKARRKLSAKQLLLLREHAGAQNPLANLGMMLQHGNSLHFKGTKRLIFLYVSRSKITSMKMPCLYRSLLL